MSSLACGWRQGPVWRSCRVCKCVHCGCAETCGACGCVQESVWQLLCVQTCTECGRAGACAGVWGVRMASSPQPQPAPLPRGLGNSHRAGRRPLCRGSSGRRSSLLIGRGLPAPGASRLLMSGSRSPETEELGQDGAQAHCPFSVANQVCACACRVCVCSVCGCACVCTGMHIVRTRVHTCMQRAECVGVHAV